MFINTNSIYVTVNGSNIYLGQYLVQATYQYNKLWGDDTGRNLAGTFSGTLKGKFPKLILQFRSLTKAELEIITPILDSARQTLTYYDPTKRANISITTYTGDYEIINKNIIDSEGAKNEGFSCSFIATSKVN
jgi:hypothetical protein